LARYQADGNIEYLGRKDQQVKVRGFRVELGEIESVMSRHEGVRESVVVAQAAANGSRQLVSYVVGREELGREGLERIQEFLRGKLPEYMVPSAWVEMDALPVTANGKVDRKRLPAPESQPKEAAMRPRTEAERLMAEIWMKVLKLEQVGINENFFELGGHSLLATQIISRVRETFEVDLPLRHLFEAPTIVRLTEHITANLNTREQLDQDEILEMLGRLTDEEIKTELNKRQVDGTTSL
jgi:acyl carrier protein